MEMVEIEIGEDGRIIRPVGVRLRVPAQLVVPEREEPDEERRARLEKFFKETDEAPKDVPVRKLCTCGGDQLVAKYRRMGFFTEDLDE